MKKTLAVALLFIPGVFAQKAEITPFVGGALGGLFPVTLATASAARPDAANVTSITLPKRLNFGLAAGYRFTDHIDGEAQWSRQRMSAHGKNDNGDDQGRLAGVTMNQFHGNVLLHYTSPEAKIRPYLLVGVGGGVLSSHEAFDGSISGFGFGVGGGVKAYLNRHFGIRLQGRYTLTNIDNTRWCGATGNCYTVSSNIWLNQKEFSLGTVFRF
jgi:outer membrane protein W